MWEYRACLPTYSNVTLDQCIHDADTIRFLIDTGFEHRAEPWIRLAGVAAPELDQTGGKQARASVKNWLTTTAGASTVRKWPFRIVTDVTNTLEPTERRTFVRYVGWVYDMNTGQCLNDVIKRILAEHPDWPAGKAARPRRPGGRARKTVR